MTVMMYLLPLHAFLIIIVHMECKGVSVITSRDHFCSNTLREWKFQIRLSLMFGNLISFSFHKRMDWKYSACKLQVVI